MRPSTLCNANKSAGLIAMFRQIVGVISYENQRQDH